MLALPIYAGWAFLVTHLLAAVPAAAALFVLGRVSKFFWASPEG